MGGYVHASDVQTITHGHEVELEDHLVPGKYVLFDFYADWCGPCRALEPHLLDLAGRHADDLALRKVDVINWDSAVARQYGMTSIPYLVLYGPDGAQIIAGDANLVPRRLTNALGGDSAPPPTGGGGRPLGLVAVAAVLALAVGILVRRRRPPETAPPSAPAPVGTTADPGDPAIWFTLLQGSLEGPFTRSQLADLVRRGALQRGADVRRRGDADWTTLGHVLD